MEPSMLIGICDDSLKCIDELEGLVHKCCTEMQIEHTVIRFSSGVELLEFCSVPKRELHLLFLDIEMPDIDGIQIKEELAYTNCVKKILFVTSHDESMQMAFGMKVIGFEKKPISGERVKKWITIVLEELMCGFITYKMDNQVHQLGINQIQYMQSAGDYSYIYQTGEMEPILVTGNLKKWEKQLEHNDFMRVHKAYIVNLSFVQRLQGGCIHLFDREQPISVGRAYDKRVKEQYEEYVTQTIRRRMV